MSEIQSTKENISTLIVLKSYMKFGNWIFDAHLKQKNDCDLVQLLNKFSYHNIVCYKGGIIGYSSTFLWS